MKLKNKKTGEIVDLSEGFIKDTYNGEKIQIKPVAISNKEGHVYGSLAELNEEWEDAPEEPKGYWWICPGCADVVHCVEDDGDKMDKYNKKIGNYFETKEEAEKAVEKLQAWKRLKDNGFRFAGVEDVNRTIRFEIPFRTGYDSCEAEADLDLLFGGEE